MPPQKSIIVDPVDILLSIFNQIDPVRAELEATIAIAEAEFEAVNVARAEKFAAAKEREAAGECIDWGPWFHDNPLTYTHQPLQKLRNQLAAIEGGWVEYSLEMFSGRSDLSESERQVWRREIRKLERDGLIERSRREVRLTEAGLDRLRGRIAAQLTELDDSDDSTT